MTSKLLHSISFLLKLVSILLGLAASPYVSMIPAKYMAVAAFIFAAASSLKDLLIVIGDYLDDGKLNKSYVGLLAGLLCCTMLLSSCLSGGMASIGAFLGSPAGQASIAAIEGLAVQLEHTVEAKEIGTLIGDANAKIAALPPKTGDVIKDFGRDMQEKGLRDFIALATLRYKAITSTK